MPQAVSTTHTMKVAAIIFMIGAAMYALDWIWNLIR
jgi:hypothetical protein